jgi:hypothetical protein
MTKNDGSRKLSITKLAKAMVAGAAALDRVNGTKGSKDQLSNLLVAMFEALNEEADRETAEAGILLDTYLELETVGK